jgi:anti-anti-sigma regulatory factor
MLKISMIESTRHCRLVLEGKLSDPWAGELKGACERARADLRGRELIVDLRNLIAISQEGENLLLELMDEGVRLRAYGVFTRHILKQLAQRKRRNGQEATR